MPTPLVTQITLDQLDGDRLIQGDGRLVSAVLTADVSLVGAAVRFILSVKHGPVWQHLLTLTRTDADLTITSETADALAIAILIRGEATENLVVTGLGRPAQFDLELTPAGGQPITIQGHLQIVPSTPTASTGTVPQPVMTLHLDDADPHPQYTQPSEIDALIQAAVEDVAPAYETTFTDANLSIAGLLSVVHNLDPSPSAVAVWNPDGEIVLPDGINFVNDAAIAIDLASYQPLAGTWKVSVTI